MSQCPGVELYIAAAKWGVKPLKVSKNTTETDRKNQQQPQLAQTGMGSVQLCLISHDSQIITVIYSFSSWATSMPLPSEKLTLRTWEVAARVWHYTSEWRNSLFILLILWLSVDRMWSDVLMCFQPSYKYTTHCQQRAHKCWDRETVFVVGVKWKPKCGKVQHTLARGTLASRLPLVLEKVTHKHTLAPEVDLYTQKACS